VIGVQLDALIQQLDKLSQLLGKKTFQKKPGHFTNSTHTVGYHVVLLGYWAIAAGGGKGMITSNDKA